MNRRFGLVGLIVVLGLIATLVSFFYKQNLGTLGLTKFGYGFPLSWYMESQIVYPDSPVLTSIIWANFFLDIFIWCIIIVILSILMIRWRKIRV